MSVLFGWYLVGIWFDGMSRPVKLLFVQVQDFTSLSRYAYTNTKYLHIRLGKYSHKHTPARYIICTVMLSLQPPAHFKCPKRCCFNSRTIPKLTQVPRYYLYLPTYYFIMYSTESAGCLLFLFWAAWGKPSYYHRMNYCAQHSIIYLYLPAPLMHPSCLTLMFLQHRYQREIPIRVTWMGLGYRIEPRYDPAQNTLLQTSHAAIETGTSIRNYY